MLEQFSQLNLDTLGLGAGTFHLVTAFVALVVALTEAFTLKGLDGLKAHFHGRDPIVEAPPAGRYRFRRADLGDIGEIHQLAHQIYGPPYQFSDGRLRQWWKANPNCFFVMLCNGRLVGYIDAFPICSSDYENLLAGKDESQIMPVASESASAESSFYIASIVVEREHRGSVLRFINKALLFYERAYPQRRWRRVCAIAYTPNGERWVKMRGMCQIDGTNVWYIDDQTWRNLADANRAFWRPLFSGGDSS